ncbi:MAG: DUF433 domain-containing protein [Rhizobiales bacterium]|nr:DUF433 domain-containing protein [Hyphomicrobiales bacterium]
MNDMSNVISAFTEEHVERLTGVTRQQLRYWDRTDFYKPGLGDENRRAAYSRIYTFKDITSLRVLNMLRNQYNVPLQHLRKVAEELAHLSDVKWTATELFVLNKRVVFVEPETEQHREILSKQYVMGIPLKIVVEDTKRDIETLQRREGDQIGKVERAKFVNHNRLVLAGTRIPVATIKQFADEGYTVQQIRDEFPTLTEADIRAAIKHKDGGMAA